MLVILLLVLLIMAGPLSTIQLPEIDAFIPVYAAAMFVNDSITAVLLFAQFSILRSHALLAISNGYLFTALFVIPWMLKLETEPKADLPQVMGDRIQLQQVLLNLITNAIDSMASKNGPRVLSVKSEVHDDGDVVVSVADTGTGIGSQDAEQIFMPLVTTKSGGMGMGLSICRSIIEAHEGHLLVVQNKPSGAVFQFSLRTSQGRTP